MKPELVAPLVRNPHVWVDNRRAEVRGLRRSAGAWTREQPPIFILGCGRSGTTILGELLARHRGVHYVLEPYARWAYVDRRTDILDLYRPGNGRALLGPSAVTVAGRRRFASVMRPRRGRVLVEKTPVNALRIGYLDALAPGARFVHIARDGVDVARSIAQYAATTVRYPGRGAFNTWWGMRDSKWRFLVRDAPAAGYPEPAGIGDDLGRGAFEWIVSLAEVERHRARLGDRLVELRYPDLLRSPAQTLRRLAAELDLDGAADWAERAASLVHAPPPAPRPAVVLPPPLADRFDRLQAAHGFTGRSIPSICR